MRMEIRAELLKIIYEHSERAWAVAKFRNSKDFIAAGNIPFPLIGRFYRLTGEWTVHPKFGVQFNVTSSFPEEADSVRGILAFLSSGKIKGVGPKTAQKIVQIFGEKTSEVLENQPFRLREVKGLKKSLVESIAEEWKKDSSRRNAFVYVSKYGVGPRTAEKIVEEVGAENVVSVLKTNPWILSETVGGIGFKRADKIALEMGIDMNSPLRLKAALDYVLSEAVSLGHTCYPAQMLVREVSKITQVEISEISVIFNEMIHKNLVRIESFSGQNYAYPFSTYRAEKTVCGEILRIMSKNKDYMKSANGAEKPSNPLEKALWNIGLSSISVITGGPGTGKTTLIKKIAQFYDGRIELCAPTGRAAKRLEEITGKKARTIHRFLGYNPATGAFTFNSLKRIDETLVIVDESSMVDIFLASSLLESLGEETKIVFVGDADQLPPVGPGIFFRDLVQFGSIPALKLEEVFRQNSESGILSGAKNILEGKKPNFNPKDFVFVKKEGASEISDEVCRIAGIEMKKRYGCRTPEAVQVITPVNGGEVGTSELNKKLAELFNPGKTRRPSLGDKVLQVQNDYDLEIFNGDTGIVVEEKKHSLTVDFSYKTVEIENEKIDNVVLGYAVTVHKSQGTEYPAVVIVLYSGHYVMLARDLLYTAVTRGKEIVIIVGDTKALYRALSNDVSSKRYFFLKERLEMEKRKER
ncbi:ATP-dependent RecD-like DNA helicase [candidate division WOR-3 bacterium]|nr:ATP-dependent RecD-like DNA helicase [candidate division WOR-3 bacterium]